jgi:ParB family chromosome partitioning protein
VTRDRRLGRGLAALLGQPLEEEIGGGVAAREPSLAPSITIHRPSATLDPLPPDVASSDTSPCAIPLNKIEPNRFQPRREFDPAEIKQLARSLEEHQLIQPILVRRQGDRYELIAGERRVRAARELGWSTISAVIRECSDRETAEIAIVENLLRKDLNPIEKAKSFARYLEEHHSTQEELAKRIGVDRSTITNLLRLLELPEPIQKSLIEGKINAGHAKTILSIRDVNQQLELCKRILEEGLSVRDCERIAQAHRELQTANREVPSSEGSENGAAPQTGLRASQLAALTQEFRRALGAKVEVVSSGAGKGKIVIHFASHDEFERLRAHLTDSTVPQSRAS